MKKEGLRDIFSFRDGKSKLFLFLSLALIFVLSVLFAAAFTLTQKNPANQATNTSRNVNFTFNVTWDGLHDSGSISNCSIWTNITGTWTETIANTSDNSNLKNGNLGFSNINLTLSADSYFNWSVACYNTSTSDGSAYQNFTANRSITIDATPPAINQTTVNMTSGPIGSVLNFTVNLSDHIGLSSANFSNNLSGTTEFSSISLSGGNFVALSNVSAFTRGGVFNFTILISDFAGNRAQNSTLVTITDTVNATAKTVFNTTFTGKYINFSGNVSDETGLVSANWTYNISGAVVNIPYNISGTSAQVSGNVALPANISTLNFILYVTDQGGNTFQNSTLITLTDPNPPTVNVTTPASGNQTKGIFSPVITVDSDASTCYYHMNGSESPSTLNKTMSLSGTTCTAASVERLKNGIYNMTFTVTDVNSNVNRYLWNFNISDNTAPNTPIASTVTVAGSTDSGNLTISLNESVNTSVFYSRNVDSLTSHAYNTAFNSSSIISLTDLYSGTMYFYVVTACDFNGNCVTGGTLNFTTNSSSTTTTSTSSSSSGSGGSVAVVSNTQASTQKAWDNVAAGSTVTMAVSSSNIAVTQIKVEAKNDLANADIKVESLKSRPTGISTDAASKVYQYLQLTKTNIPDTSAASITINFKVAKSWLASNNIADVEVALYRYTSGAWNILSTSITGSDSTNVMYQATTPGFSTFAIGSGGNAAVPAPVITSVEICDDGADNDGDTLVDSADSDCQAIQATPSAEICDDGADNDGDTLVDSADSDCQAVTAATEEPALAMEEQGGKSSWLTTTIIAAIIIVLVLMVYAMLKKKSAN